MINTEKVNLKIQNKKTIQEKDLQKDKYKIFDYK